MKGNVDLTANKIFSDPHRVLSDMFDIMGVKLYPWSINKLPFREIESDFRFGETALILCGSASERARLHEAQLYEAGCLCERCGALISQKPWKASGCLCSKCYDEIEEQCEIKWRYKEPPVWDSDDRVVIEMNKRQW